MKAKAILLLLGSFSVGAFAQNAQQEKTPLFVKLDKNKDGYVSRAEARADKGVAKFFDKADANHDGASTKTKPSRPATWRTARRPGSTLTTAPSRPR